MLHEAHLRLSQFRTSSYSLHRHLKFLTTAHSVKPHIERYQTSEHLYTHLLEPCLRQCNQIQSRRLFDQMPQRLALASRENKRIHAQSLKLGFSSEGRLANAIVDLYAKCGELHSAERAFFCLSNKDTVSWNSILSMYSRHGLLNRVTEGFWSMLKYGLAPNQFSFAIVLSACARLMNFHFGKQVHCSILKMGFEFDSFCEGSLIDMYSKCGNLVDARMIFDGALEPDTVSCTAMISGYIQVGLPEEAIKVFEKMQRMGRSPDTVAFVTLINLYMGLRRFDDAWLLFSKMPNPNVVAWNVMISGNAKGGYEEEAIRIFQIMRKSGVHPTRSTLGSVLSAVASLANLVYGSQVHSQAMKQGLESNVYVGSSLINMYAKCQKIEAAEKVFNELTQKNDVLWNALLGGYAQNGNAIEVIHLFMKMRFSGLEPDGFTYTSILSACACLGNIDLGHQLHSIVIKGEFAHNLFVGNALVDMYAKSGAINDARKQFELIRERDHVSWNAIIVGYVQEEDEEEAFKMFRRMLLDGIAPDEVSLASIVSACANIHAFSKGKQVHCFLLKCGLETSLYAGSSLIDMYCKCGVTGDASEIFSCMPKKSVVSINALIAGYAQKGTAGNKNIEEAVKMFQYMQAEGLKPSEVTFACILDSCDSCDGHTDLSLGRQMHCFVIKLGFSYRDEFLAISLLGMYINSQEKVDANLLFYEFPTAKSAVVWTAMISGQSQIDCCGEALLWYKEMHSSNVMPDQATFASVLKACSVLASLCDGRQVHSLIFHTGYDMDELLGGALIDMYAKCGDVMSSFQVFNEMDLKKDIISWNSMIVGFAKNGYAENALDIFDEMKQKKLKPDEITFLGVLTACSHAGLVSEGRQIFNSMTSQYGVQPRVDHCACMIDLLGRCGFLKEAEDFIDKLNYHDAMIWAAYLNACRIHGDEIRGQHAAEKLMELEPQNSSAYILLSNIYAASGNWSGVNYTRREMKMKEVRKFPGCSWIELGQKTHLFFAGDKSHPSAGEIHAILDDLTALIKDEGYVAGIESFVFDED